MDGPSVENELAIQDRVLVEAEIYGRPVSFRAVIVRICPTEPWLGLASPDRRLETMPPSQTVRLTVARDGAALLGLSRFLRHLGGGRSRVFAVVRPAMLERIQRRAHVRYPIDLPIQFRRVDPATWDPRGRASTTGTKNLSPGGLLIVGDAAVNVGDDLDLTLPLSGGDWVSMNGVVKRLGRGRTTPNVARTANPIARKLWSSSRASPHSTRTALCGSSCSRSIADARPHCAHRTCQWLYRPQPRCGRYSTYRAGPPQRSLLSIPAAHGRAAPRRTPRDGRRPCRHARPGGPGLAHRARQRRRHPGRAHGGPARRERGCGGARTQRGGAGPAHRRGHALRDGRQALRTLTSSCCNSRLSSQPLS